MEMRDWLTATVDSLNEQVRQPTGAICSGRVWCCGVTGGCCCPVALWAVRLCISSIHHRLSGMHICCLACPAPTQPTNPANPPAHQIEEFEAEAEAAASTKKGKKPAPRVVHMEESIARHRQHIVRLEQILRLLDNDAMAGTRLSGWVGQQGRGVAHAVEVEVMRGRGHQTWWKTYLSPPS